MKTLGDGFLATFDSPTRAVQCARAVRDGLRRLGLEIRAGLHTGECDVTPGDVAGIAVHVAARVQAAAEPGEILVSGPSATSPPAPASASTTAAATNSKGIDGDWALYARRLISLVQVRAHSGSGGGERKHLTTASGGCARGRGRPPWPRPRGVCRGGCRGRG